MITWKTIFSEIKHFYAHSFMNAVRRNAPIKEPVGNKNQQSHIEKIVGERGAREK